MYRVETLRIRKLTTVSPCTSENETKKNQLQYDDHWKPTPIAEYLREHV